MFDGEKKILYFIYRLLDRRVRLRSNESSNREVVLDQS